MRVPGPSGVYSTRVTSRDDVSVYVVDGISEYLNIRHHTQQILFPICLVISV